jgi:Ca2+-binding RTX toxin-like protein
VRRLAATALCAATCLTLAPDAFTATAFVGAGDRFAPGEVLWYIADQGEVNRVTIETNPDNEEEVEITDTGATISPGAGCTSLAPTRVRCLVSDERRGEPTVEVKLGDGDDFLESDGLNGVFRGEDGNDTIVGGRGGVGFFEYLFGGAGNDLLRGRSGSDVLNGGLGADVLNGGSSIDCFDLFCTQMTDTVTYAGRTNGVVADADGLADDGEPGEGDLIRGNVEHIVGGRGNDLLTASTSRGSTSGGPIVLGSTLEGRAGNDLLRGSRGRDDLIGQSGNDVLRGFRGNDFISGWSGDDRLVGNSGRDRLGAGGGRDFISARDGQPDRVSGGPGSDEARIDSGLDRVRSVERILP